MSCAKIGPVTSEEPRDQVNDREPARRVTSYDVARESGVSRTTVSYVLNDTPGKSISADTRTLVRDTAERLGFAPSPAARILRSGRSDVVLVLLPSWVTSVVTEVFLETMSELLGRSGLTLLVHYGPTRGPFSQIWRAVIPRAIISVTPFTSAEMREMTRAGIQGLTTIDASPDRFGGERALQENIGRLQVDHLVSAGHTSIGYATTSAASLSLFAAPRLAGVMHACAERGLPAPSLATVPLDIDAARSVLAAWSRPSLRITAAAAYNDEVALALLGAARLEGIDVPRDLAVIGVDDMPAAQLVLPRLTTVTQAIGDEARYLAGLILAADNPGVEAPERPTQYLSVVVRESA